MKQNQRLKVVLRIAVLKLHILICRDSEGRKPKAPAASLRFHNRQVDHGTPGPGTRAICDYPYGSNVR
jgi:hypothetical protein